MLAKTPESPKAPKSPRPPEDYPEGNFWIGTINAVIITALFFVVCVGIFVWFY